MIVLVLVAAGWAVFRSSSLSQAGYLFTHAGFATSSNTATFALRTLYFTLPLVAVQVFQLYKGSPVVVAKLNPWLRGGIYGVLVCGILIFSQHAITRFIYQGF
jgi:hypothetical protein